MIKYITFRGKAYRTIKLYIHPNAQFNDILLVLNSLRFNNVGINEEQIIFAILELINNSLRAHREKKKNEKISVIFHVKNNYLYIKIQDWGGGFDPSALPYDISDNPEHIDTNSDVFHEYRETHGYKRFGIGLYVVKKTFHKFTLYFIDENHSQVDLESGKTAGTCIELGIGEGR
jgi:sensor histidine kinase regulating citrate/malate metabolism